MDLITLSILIMTGDYRHIISEVYEKRLIFQGPYLKIIFAYQIKSDRIIK